MRRGQPLPQTSRLRSKVANDSGPPVPDESIYRIVDAIDEVAEETGRTIPQIALNSLLQRPSVASVIIGARTEAQLRQNLDAVGWNLTGEQVARLDTASATTLPYPLAPAPVRGAQPAAGVSVFESTERSEAIS